MGSCKTCDKPNQGPLCGLCTAIAKDRKTAAKSKAKKPKKKRKERWELCREVMPRHKTHERPVTLGEGDWAQMQKAWG